MKTLIYCTVLTVGIALYTIGSAHAGYPAVRCHGNKLKHAGAYGLCLLKAESEAVQHDEGADFGKCDQRFTFRWQNEESKAGAGVCPTEGDEADVRNFITSCSLAVTDALAGAPLPEDVLTCNADLTDCSSDLSSCESDLALCGCGCPVCNSDLATCQSDLGTCNSNYADCSSDLATCNSSSNSCNASLATCTGGTAGAADVLSGKTFSSNAGLGVTGTMVNVGHQNVMPGTAPAAIIQGYHDGTGAVAGDPDLVATNIAADVDIFGVVGVGESAAHLVRTGQTTCYDANGAVISCAGTGQDGELQNGVARSFTDNGDGTVSDNVTGLMWEKISNDNSIHDKDNTYTWMNAFASKIATLNASSFAGHSDWRVPNRFELYTIDNLGTSEATYPPFETGCVPGCTVLTCSCTERTHYWTSTTNASDTSQTWNVVFDLGGYDNADAKTSNFAVRAVRGGS